MSPWNKNKAVGPKQALTSQQVFALCDVLVRERNWYDLSLFSLAIDTALRSSDLLSLTWADVYLVEDDRPFQFRVKQQKTGRIVDLLLSTYTNQVITHRLRTEELDANGYLFASPVKPNAALTTAAYRNRIKRWVKSIGLPPEPYSSHSLRRTRAQTLYEHCNDIEVVRIVLGQASIASTQSYLGIDQRKAFEKLKEVPLLPETFSPCG